jgi:lysophospholipase L1-like esterase
MTPRVKQAVLGFASIVVSVAVGLFGTEMALRLKNRSMKNYDIEMWRYARELKRPSDNPLLGHVHVPNRTAVLQSAEIRTNDLGLRGGPVAPRAEGQRRILVLGSSITLGWGVPENETMTARLEAKFKADGQNVEVLNAGIGNYNSVRYVNNFLLNLTSTNPTDIVVHYFLRDGEDLEMGRGNWLLKNSQLAVTLWNVVQKVTRTSGENALETHYRNVYALTSPGRKKMEEALGRLAEYAKAHKIQLYLAMTPDVHNLTDYKLGFIHEELQQLSAKLGFQYVDLLPALKGLTPEKIWSMPGDPHPNGLGHQLMAEALYPVLKGNSPESRAVAGSRAP